MTTSVIESLAGALVGVAVAGGLGDGAVVAVAAAVAGTLVEAVVAAGLVAATVVAVGAAVGGALVGAAVGEGAAQPTGNSKNAANSTKRSKRGFILPLLR